MFLTQENKTRLQLFEFTNIGQRTQRPCPKSWRHLQTTIVRYSKHYYIAESVTVMSKQGQGLKLLNGAIELQPMPT